MECVRRVVHCQCIFRPFRVPEVRRGEETPESQSERSCTDSNFPSQRCVQLSRRRNIFTPRRPNPAIKSNSPRCIQHPSHMTSLSKHTLVPRWNHITRDSAGGARRVLPKFKPTNLLHSELPKQSSSSYTHKTEQLQQQSICIYCNFHLIALLYSDIHNAFLVATFPILHILHIVVVR